MKYPTQDPKFHIQGGCLINASTGVPIPADEPIFILRAKDLHAIQTLYAYRNFCEDGSHVAAVEARIEEFEQFARTHADRMKEPDTGKAQPV